jgi:thiol-disulfide isomerase/thioredoxin
MDAMTTVTSSNARAAESCARMLRGRLSIPRSSTSVVACGWTAAMLFAVASLQFAMAQDPPKNVVQHGVPKTIAAISFEDSQGRSRSLADFKGKVVALNIWATWCGPCRAEMPALDRLQAALGGRDFEVVPVSIDRGGIDLVKKFYAEINIRNLAIYVDTSGQVMRTLGAIGVPTTLVIDRAGNEVGRITGPAEWDAPEIAEFLKPIIAKQNDTTETIGQDVKSPAPDKDHSPGPLVRGFQWVKTLFNR